LSSYSLAVYLTVFIIKGKEMKITLRKASALQTSIQDAIKAVEVTVKVDLNEFEDTAEVLAKANANTINSDIRRASLSACLYDIRSLVGSANAMCGINDRLAKAAYIDKRLGQLATLVQADALQDSMIVINGKVEKLKSEKGENSRRSIYGYSDTVSTGVLTQEQISGFKAQVLDLKKSKQTLNDEILELNVRTEVELPTEVELVLNQEGLI
jgi:hypothetical protein